MDRTVLILKSSPRKRGNSSILAEQAANGAREGGANVEVFDLSRMKIQPCRHCDKCRKGDGSCGTHDDMETLYPRLIETDALILASPIYWFTYNAQLKLCIDRWYGLNYKHHDFLRDKPVGIILTYADANLVESGGINAVNTFESTFRYLQASIAGIVHGSASDPGDVLQNPGLMQEAFDLGHRLGRPTEPN